MRSTGSDVDAVLLAALEAVDQAVCIADMREPDQPLVYVNPAFTRTTGYPPEQALGRNCRFLQHGLDVADGAAQVRAVLASGRPGVVTLLNRRADGRAFSNELSLSPLHGSDGAVTHYVAVQRDVSARVAAERSRDVLLHERAELGDQLQAQLVPERLTALPGFEVAVRYHPASRPDGTRGEVSGDFYDVLPTAGAGRTVVIGDVSGRGPRAAATTSALRWSLRGASTGTSSPSALLSTVAGAVHGGLGDDFATVAALAVPVPSTGSSDDVVLALGGHPPGVLLPVDGRPRAVGTPGTLLGPFPDGGGPDAKITLRTGDQLVLYTDGVTEAMDPAGTLLGDEGLLAALDAVPHTDRTSPHAAELTAAAVTRAVREHVRGGAVDDLTLLVLHRTGEVAPADPGGSRATGGTDGREATA